MGVKRGLRNDILRLEAGINNEPDEVTNAINAIRQAQGAPVVQLLRCLLMVSRGVVQSQEMPWGISSVWESWGA